MKILILKIIFICSIFLNANGQEEFAPMGSKWYYTNIESYLSSNEGFVTIENIGDTVIQNLNCKILEETEFRTNGDTIKKRLEYIHVSGDTIRRYGSDEQFYILYNFSANVGDTWICKSYYEPLDEDLEFEVSVDSISTIVINGSNLKSMFYSTSNEFLSYGNGSVTQLLGGTWYMFPFNYAFIDTNIRIGLRCYTDPSFGQFNSGISSECTEMSVTAIEDVFINNKINIYPNPSLGKIFIESDENLKDYNLINIYSIDGTLIKSLDLKYIEDIPILEIVEMGFYIVEFIGDTHRAVKKIIIK